MTTNKKRLYRFRPLVILPEAKPPKTVVDELLARELYLGTLEQNNDPMDGMQDAYWDGDDIVWGNFIRHYCFCLLNAAYFVSVAGDSIPFGPEQIVARATPDVLPDAPIKQIFEDFISAVMADEKISGLMSLLIEKQRLTQEELRLLLDIYNRQFLALLAGTFSQHGHGDFLEGLDQHLPNIELTDFEAVARLVDNKTLRAMARSLEQASHQMRLLGLCEHASGLRQQPVAKKNLLRLTGDFPTLYLNECVKAIYDEYYIACFTEQKDDPSIWGHYASGHSGIGLIFEFEEHEGLLKMQMKDKTHLQLHQVIYGSEPPMVNFFESLGYLTKTALHKHWLSSGERVSPLASQYNSSDFRSAYWQTYVATVSHKFSEWAREREYRAVRSAWFYGRKPNSERVMQYEEKHLKGVIFGMRTPIEMQVQIMSALDDTLSEAQKAEFEFYSARYCPVKKKLEINRLDLLKFEGPNHHH